MTRSSPTKLARIFAEYTKPRKGDKYRHLVLDLQESPRPNHYLHATKGYRKISPARQALYVKSAMRHAQQQSMYEDAIKQLNAEVLEVVQTSEIQQQNNEDNNG